MAPSALSPGGLGAVGDGVKAGGGIALAPLPLGGRRRSAKKLRLVKKKTVRKMLKKMGLKLRGGNVPGATGAEDAEGAAGAEGAEGEAAKGGRRRRRRTGRKGKKSRKVFGLF